MGTKFVAAVEKSRWGADQRWGYSIVGLNRDDTIIAKLHAKSAKSTASRPLTIDLGDDEEPYSSSTKPRTAKNKRTRNKTKRSHLRPPAADSSSKEEADNDSDNSFDVDHNDGDGDEYQSTDASSGSDDDDRDSDDGEYVDADDSD